MSRRRRSSASPDSGEDERYDRLAHRIRVAAWGVLLPALIVAAFVWKAPDHEIPSTVLRAARPLLGLGSFDQVRFAILERTGGISIIPWGTGATPPAR